jgi:hypothetical protein
MIADVPAVPPHSIVLAGDYIITDNGETHHRQPLINVSAGDRDYWVDSKGKRHYYSDDNTVGDLLNVRL